MKDRNPAPLNDLDQLLQYIHGKVVRTTNQLIVLMKEGRSLTNSLSTTTQLMTTLISIGSGLKPDQTSFLCSLVSSYVPNMDSLLGWEEMTLMSINQLLSRNQSNETAISTVSSFAPVFEPTNFSLPDSSVQLKNQLTQLIDLVYQDKMTLSLADYKPKSSTMNPSPPPGVVNNKSSFVVPSTDMIPEEEEEEDKEDTRKMNGSI